MRIEAVELRQLELPMVEPLAAAHGVVNMRKTVLVRVLTDGADGWGECVALNEPTYTADWSDGEYEVMRDFFIPALFQVGELVAEEVIDVLSIFKMHNPAKTAIEMAVLDSQLRTQGVSLATYWDLGSPAPVDCAVVVGLLDGDAMLNAIESHLSRGYRHLKLKVVPGRDVQRVDLVRKRFPELSIRIDANGSYLWHDKLHRDLLRELDTRGLVLIEQPLSPDSPLPYVELCKEMETPISLDESISSVARAKIAMDLGGCDVITLKPGLLGGYLRARALHDLCQDRGFPVTVGGMLETGLARAANLALASLPGARFPAEIAPDFRWFPDRVNSEPVEIHNGRIAVPTTPGIGADLDMSTVDRLTRRVHVARPG